MNRIDRRHFIATAGAATALTVLPAAAAAPRSGQSGTDRLLAEVAEDLLREYPESASGLGIDKGARSALKARLADRSLAGRARHAREATTRLAGMRAEKARRPDAAALLNIEVAETAHQLALEGYHFPYGDVAILNQNWSYRNAPYVVAQNTCAFVEIPDFLETNHHVATRADAEAYLARLDQYGAALDGETERLRHDRGLGVVAPDFLLDKTLRQMRASRAEPIEQWGVVTSLAKKSAKLGGD